MNVARLLALAAATTVVAACAADAPLATSDALLASGSGGGTASGGGAVVRVRCELRAGRRSKISVDGNNLVPAGAMWSARVTSGANTAAAPARAGVGDEVEFDFDSDPADIAAGAIAIARSFIVVNPSGPDVQAAILDAAGNVAATGAADCRTR